MESSLAGNIRSVRKTFAPAIVPGWSAMKPWISGDGNVTLFWICFSLLLVLGVWLCWHCASNITRLSEEDEE